MDTPAPLPQPLLEQSPSVKLLYSWLEPQGAVSYTVREIEEALALSHRAVQEGLTRLRELGLLHDIEAAAGRRRGSFYVSARAGSKRATPPSAG